MQIEIEYCVPCGYLPRATDAQTRILEAFGNRVESVSLKTCHDRLDAISATTVDDRDTLIADRLELRDTDRPLSEWRELMQHNIGVLHPALL